MSDGIHREKLAGTDLEVSNVGFGTYKLGMKLGETAAVSLLGYSFYFHGINLIDTSDNYPAAEEIIGKAFRDKTLLRDDIVIASKTGLATSQEEANEFHAQGRKANISPERIKKKVEESLGVMGIEAIDLYQLHTYDPKVAPADIAYTMTRLINEGKIRYWGVCNYTKAQLDELLETCRATGAIMPVTYQQYNNMADRPFETDIHHAKSEGLGVLGFSPLAKGAITSAYAVGYYFQQRPVFEQSLKTNVRMTKKDQLLYKQTYALMRLHELAQEGGYTLQQLAVAWSLGNPDIDVTLLGAYSKQHMDELASATTLELDSDVQEKADELHEQLSNL